MSNKEHIEDICGERFREEEKPISDRVWQNIKSTLPPEKTDNTGISPFSWKLGGLVIAITGIVLAYNLLNSTEANFGADNKVVKDLNVEANVNFSKYPTSSNKVLFSIPVNSENAKEGRSF